VRILFYSISSALGIFSALLGLGFAFCSNARLSRLVSLPREPKIIGWVIGIPVLLWSAHLGVQMLEGDLACYRAIVWCLLPVAIILCGLLLDYLNARALGGLLLLCATHLISAGFAFNVPLRPIYSTICILVGIMGMIGIATPWRYRDAFILANKNRLWSRSLGGFFILSALTLLILPWLS